MPKGVLKLFDVMEVQMIFFFAISKGEIFKTNTGNSAFSYISSETLITNSL